MSGVEKCNRDLIWQEIRRRRNFRFADIQRVVPDMASSGIVIYVKTLIAGGYVAKEGDGYRLIKDNGIHRPQLKADGSPLPPNARQRMWMAMKAMSRFDHRDIAMAAQTTMTSSKSYLNALHKAGYLAIIKSHMGIHRAGRPTPRYIFVRRNDTGPKCPRIRKNGSVFDANLGKVIWPESEST